jgi:hypothetical protein
MDNGDYLQLLGPDPVYQAIGSDNHFAYAFVLNFRNHSPRVREVGQPSTSINDAAHK